MKRRRFMLGSLLAATCAVAAADEHFAGFVNKGLLGIGRIPAAQFDRAGATNDTLGGMFSGMCIDSSSWRRSGSAQRGLTYSGTLYALADRGFGDGATDYRPRMHAIRIEITPFYGATTMAQDQISLTHKSTTVLTYNGQHFTGFDAGNTNRVDWPHSLPGSPARGRRALDSEGLVQGPDNGFFVSDEYGPFIYAFNAAGELQAALVPPAALIPKRGAFPGRNVFTAAAAPDSGRRNNRGFEGLTLVPGKKRLAALLQSPTVQDCAAGTYGRFTRLLQFEAEADSPRFGQLLSEHLYPLTVESNSSTNDYTVVSEVLAIDEDRFLVLERDGLGLGADSDGVPKYKCIVLASTAPATDIARTRFDLEHGAPGQLSLDADELPAGLRPMARQDWINLLDPVELGRFGLNLNTRPDRNTLSEKWEGLALVPMRDPEHPDDYLLLVGNDNDFKSPIVVHNREIVATNAVTVDSMLLAYRVTVPKRSPD